MADNLSDAGYGGDHDKQNQNGCEKATAVIGDVQDAEKLDKVIAAQVVYTLPHWLT